MKSGNSNRGQRPRICDQSPTSAWRAVQPEGRDSPPVLRRTALQAAFVVCYLYRGRCPRLLFGSALQAPERMWGTCDVIALQAPECILGSGNVIFHPH